MAYVAARHVAVTSWGLFYGREVELYNLGDARVAIVHHLDGSEDHMTLSWEEYLKFKEDMADHNGFDDYRSEWVKGVTA